MRKTNQRRFEASRVACVLSMVASLTWCCAPNRIDSQGPDEIWYIDPDIRGWIALHYLVEGAPALPCNADTCVVVVKGSKVVHTSSRGKFDHSRPDRYRMGTQAKYRVLDIAFEEKPDVIGVRIANRSGRYSGIDSSPMYHCVFVGTRDDVLQRSGQPPAPCR
jgi:hypothetical protein